LGLICWNLLAIRYSNRSEQGLSISNSPSSAILFTSLPADIREGNVAPSKTFISREPRRASSRAIEQPQVPAPMTSIDSFLPEIHRENIEIMAQSDGLFDD
jgi:hypothetical protein